MAPDSLFQIGSITKVYTATLILALAADGRCDLDDPVRAVLPEFRLREERSADDITIRHLLSHTSGIDGDCFVDTGRGDDCLSGYVAAMQEVTLLHEPGAAFSYCNAGYSLLGRVAEVLTGQVWDEALREWVLRGVGAERTFSLPEDVLRHSVSVGHQGPSQCQRVSRRWTLMRSVGPAGLLCADAADVAAMGMAHVRAAHAVSADAVLAPEWAVQMLTPHADLPEPYTIAEQVGLGWFISGEGQRVVHGHDGNILGQASFLRVLPGCPAAVAVLANGGLSRAFGRTLLSEAVREIAGIQMPSRPGRAPASPDAHARVGVYGRREVRHEVTPAAQGGLRLRSVKHGPLKHVLGDGDETSEFVPAAGGLYVETQPPSSFARTLAFVEVDGREHLHFNGRTNPRLTPAGEMS